MKIIRPLLRLWWLLSLGLVNNGFGAETFFVTQHIDFRPIYDSVAGRFTNIVVHNNDESPARDYQSNDVVMVVPLTAKLTIPEGLPPEFLQLGPAGSPLWILPMTQNPNLVFLGISAEDPSVFGFADPLEFRLLAVETLRTNNARGHFIVWDANAPEFFMNTRDGISGADKYDLFPSFRTHTHLEWGFNTSGIYRVTFQAVGPLIGGTSNLVSPPATFVFHVLPLSPIESWQTNRWPSTAGKHLVGLGADPDGDSVPNLSEYAFGTNPNQPGATNLPTYLTVTVSGTNYGALRYTRSKAATDVVLTPEMAPAPGGPWTAMTNLVSTVDQGTTQLITYRDPNPVATSTNRYGRVRVILP